MDRNALSHRTLLAGLALLLVIALAALGTAGCAKSSKRVEVAADYVRCSVNADYEAMSKVVAKAARPYCYAMAAAPPNGGSEVKIAKETREQDSLIFEIEYGPTSTFLRLSPPKNDKPNDVMVESWNKQGARSAGTLTVAQEGGRYVVTHVNGTPIDEVLSGGSGGL